jgi:hypothetical protein
MSYDEDFRRKHPCPCGKGEWEEVGLSNDWGQSRTSRTILWEACVNKYVWQDTTSDYERGRRKGESGRWITKSPTK